MRLPELLLAAALAGSLGGGCSTAPATVDETATAPRKIGVNSHLWHASLEILSFMPLVTVDPHGGIIISDWYAPTSNFRERLKVTVHIADLTLRPDALKVTVFRQEGIGSEWRFVPADPSTSRILKDRILTRARNLAVAAAAQS